jgi:cytochrome P450
MDDEPFLKIAALLDNPDIALKRAREHGALVASDLGPFVVQHGALRALLQDDRFTPSFASHLEQMGITTGPFHAFMSRTPLSMAGEEHRRWRKLVMQTFTPRSVERLRPFLRREAERLIDAFPETGSCDFMAGFARQLPSLGLCELIGVPHDDRARFCAWADTIGLGFNLMLLREHIDDVNTAIVQLLDYAGELIAERKRAPCDDLVTRLAHAARIDDLDDDYVNTALAGLVFAGHETTKNQLGWMLVVLSEAKGEWDRVCAQPQRVRDVVEEVLRFRSAATSISRVSEEPTELFGTPIPAGAQLLGSLWSANRDPSAFACPDEFDVDKNRGGVQIAFGQGAHHCLGAALARAELQEALVSLSARLHCPRLEPGADYLPALGIAGPTTLPIAFERRADVDGERKA